MGQAIPAMKMNRGRVIRMFNDRNGNVNSFVFVFSFFYGFGLVQCNTGQVALVWSTHTMHLKV